MKVFQKNNNNLTINFENSDNEIEVTEFENEPVILVNGESVSGSTKGMTKFTSEDTIYVEDEWIAIENDLLPEGGFSSNITVVFDGVEYPNIPKITHSFDGDTVITYGASFDDNILDYSVYPFCVLFYEGHDGSQRIINTKTNGNHTISITGFVGGSIGPDLLIIYGTYGENIPCVCNKTFAEVIEWLEAGKPYIITFTHGAYDTTFVSSAVSVDSYNENAIDLTVHYHSSYATLYMDSDFICYIND